jgi:hypothetical protein
VKDAVQHAPQPQRTRRGRGGGRGPGHGRGASVSGWGKLFDIVLIGRQAITA